MTSSLRSIQAQTEHIIVALHDGSGHAIRMGTSKESPSPLNTLESAIAGSVGLNLLTLTKVNTIEALLDDLSYSVKISEDRIKIYCRCPGELRELFKESVQNCSIRKLLNLACNIHFMENKSGRNLREGEGFVVQKE